MKLGYARVSTEEQNLQVQCEELQRAGVQGIWQEHISGNRAARPELETLLLTLQPRDVLVVTKLDRLARSTRDLLEIVERIGKSGASFVSLAEPWADTTSPAGKLIMTVFAGVAQFERERMMERCDAGRIRAKQDGVRFGRKPVLTSVQREAVKSMLKDGEPPRAVARVFNVHASTIYRMMQGPA